MRKFFKRIKKLFKDLFERIVYKFKPNSLSKKTRKKIKKEKKISQQYSTWGNILRWMTGCNDLKIATN